MPANLLDERYRLVEVVGHGRQAVVWRAVDERLRRVVAVKVFRTATGTHSADIRGGFEAMARLSHHNVLRMYDGGYVARSSVRQPYLVLELVDGAALTSVLRRGGLAPVFVARLGLALAGALAHVHERHAVHGAVRPANILVPGRGAALIPEAAKLADLRIADDAADEIYASPEEKDGRGAGAPGDVYSLGLVLTQALTQCHGGTPGHDAGLGGLLVSMCRPDPAARPPAAEVARRLAVVVSTAAGAAEAGRRPLRRRGARSDRGARFWRPRGARVLAGVGA